MIRYLKRLNSSTFVHVKAFPMYGDIGVSAPSLYRESTDSLIHALQVLETVVLTSLLVIMDIVCIKDGYVIIIMTVETTVMKKIVVYT